MIKAATLRKLPPGKRIYEVWIPAHDKPAGIVTRHVPEIREAFFDLPHARAFLDKNDPRNWGKPQSPLLLPTTAGDYLRKTYGR